MVDRMSHLLLVFLFIVAPDAWSYAVVTHQWLTDHAFDRSVVARDPTLSESMGLSSIDELLSDSEGNQRKVKSIVVIGSRYEDDGIRPLNHFFDPQNGGRGLTVVAEIGHPSPRWVLEDEEDYGAQLFSMRDAHLHMYNAMTGVTDAQRKEQFAILFESLGRAVHHIQDMSQPEHVRNDQHLPTPSWTSSYENYTETQTEENRLSSGEMYGNSGVVDISKFGKARRFWQFEGKGIAEFTSHNFLSNDTSFLWPNPGNGLGPATDPEFKLPKPIPCGSDDLLEYVDAAELGDVANTGVVAFAGTQVWDAYLGETLCNRRTTSLSVLTENSARRLQRYLFSPNRFTFDAAHELLIPRAIAYSAGFIDYIFRGRLKVESFTLEGAQATLQVRNVSAASFPLSDSESINVVDEFEIWYESTAGQRRRAQVLNGNLRGKTIGTDGIHDIEFLIPVDVDRKAKKPYIVVFRGKVGEEDSVIGQVFGASGAVVINPSIAPTDGIGGSRVLNRTDGGWELSSVRGAVAGNVDWRGFNGDVVTWDGPQSRYFLSNAQRNGVSPNIYAGGALVAKAPGNVLGAAMRRARNSWDLIAAVINGETLTIYARSLAEQSDSAFSVTANPHGWRLLGTVVVGVPDSPVFFNASGTEAQLMSDRFFYRHKIGVTNGSISASRTESRGRGERVFSSDFDLTVSPQPSRDVLYSHSMKSRTRVAINWVESTVICADYRADVEVLCKVVGGTESDDEFTDTMFCTMFCKTGSWTLDKSFSETARRVLTAGSMTIVLGGTEKKGTANNSDRTAGSFSSLHVWSMNEESRFSRIFYLDVRNNLAVYESEFEATQTSSTTTAPTNRWESHTVRKKSKHVELIALTGPSGRQTLASRMDDLGETVDDRSDWLRQEYSALLSDGRQTVSSSSHYENPQPYVGDTFNFSLAYIHPAALGPANQGFAVTDDGSIVASMEKWQRQPNGDDRRMGGWSYLSGSSLSSVVPGAEAEGNTSVYYPIGLIR